MADFQKLLAERRATNAAREATEQEALRGVAPKLEAKVNAIAAAREKQNALMAATREKAPVVPAKTLRSAVLLSHLERVTRLHNIIDELTSWEQSFVENNLSYMRRTQRDNGLGLKQLTKLAEIEKDYKDSLLAGESDNEVAARIRSPEPVDTYASHNHSVYKPQSFDDIDDDIPF